MSKAGPLRMLTSTLALLLAATGVATAQDYEAEFNRQWGLRMIGVDKALARGLDGSGVLVAVTDTGLDTGLSPYAPLHPELVGRFIGLSIDGYENAPLAFDGNMLLFIHEWHGTHVAGIIAANRDGKGMVGVASGSTIVPMRVISGYGTGTYGDAAALYYSLHYGVSNDVHIYNASWGPASGYNYYYNRVTRTKTFFTPEQAVANLSWHANTFGHVVDNDGVMVFATANLRTLEPEMSLQVDAAMPYYFPDLERGWLAVTALGSNGLIAEYAQYCSVGMMWCLAAPGGDLNVNNGGGIYSLAPPWQLPADPYRNDSGTSMAAPHVSGALAIAKQLYPNASYQDLRLLVLHTATDIGAQGVDPIYGWGMLNVGNLVETASPAAGAIYADQLMARQGVINHLIDTLNPTATSERGGTWGYWLQPLAISGTANATTIAAGGISAGIEGSIAEDWYLKLFGGLSQSSASVDGNVATDTGIHVGGQLVYETQDWFADATLGVSVFNGNVTRKTAPGMAGTVLATTGGVLGESSTLDAAQWAAFRFGHHFDIGEAGNVSPYLFGRAANQQLSPFSEGGSAVGLSGGGANNITGELGLGIKWMGPALAAGPMNVTPVLDFAYSKQGADYRRGFDLLGNEMTAAAGPVGADTLQISTALEMTSSESPFNLKLGYSAQIQSGSLMHAASFKLMGAF